MQTLDIEIKKAERVLQQVFLLAVFFVPFSTVLTNVFVAATYLAVLAALLGNRKMLQGARFTPAMLALALFLLFVIGSTWSIAPAGEIRNAIGKYTKLFLIPIGMMLTYRDPALVRRMLIWFLCGTGVLLLACYLTLFDLMPRSSHGWWSVGSQANPVALKNYITFGILVSFSGMICFAYYRYAATLRARLLSLGLGLLYIIPPVFFTLGRTGYIALLVGMLTLCFLRYRANWKMLVLSMLAAGLMVGGFYAVSNTFQTRTDHLVKEINDYANSDMEKSTGVNFADTKEENSSGIRLNFYRAGLIMISQHPVFGLGTGSFQEGFAPTSKKLWPSSDPKHAARHQPHSEVIMIGVQLGLAGLALYLALLGSMAWEASRKNSYAADVMLIMLAIFFTTALFNSLIWDFTEGYWITLMSGALYGYLKRDGSSFPSATRQGNHE